MRLRSVFGGSDVPRSKSLVLDNLTQDPSTMKEVLAMQLFARVGLPAPREAFVRLFVNNVLPGAVRRGRGRWQRRSCSATSARDNGTLYEYNWTFDLQLRLPRLEPRPLPHLQGADQRPHGRRSTSSTRSSGWCASANEAADDELRERHRAHSRSAGVRAPRRRRELHLGRRRLLGFCGHEQLLPLQARGRHRASR